MSAIMSRIQKNVVMLQMNDYNCTVHESSLLVSCRLVSSRVVSCRLVSSRVVSLPVYDEHHVFVRITRTQCVSTPSTTAVTSLS